MRPSENPEWDPRSTSFFNVADLPDPSIQCRYGIAAIMVTPPIYLHQLSILYFAAKRCHSQTISPDINLLETGRPESIEDTNLLERWLSLCDGSVVKQGVSECMR
jgi:hypothetical protein